MVTIPTGLAINASDPTARTTASGFRQVLATIFKQNAVGSPTVGIIPAPGNPLLVTTRSDMTYDVAAGFAVTTRSGQGAYLVGTPTAVNVTTTAGDASNPRYDRLYIVQPDPELSETGFARIDVAIGTPAATPSLPSLPTGALELARKLVPAGATNTNSGTALTNYATKTTLNLSATIADISGLQSALDGKMANGSSVAWSALTAIPGGVAGLAGGTIPDTNLPTRLQPGSQNASGNWNSYRSSGFYFGDNLVNSPALGSGDNFYAVYVIGDGTNAVQMATAYGGTYAGRVYRRWSSGDATNGFTWSGWGELTTDNTKLTNGSHSLTLSGSGTLALDGQSMSNAKIFNGSYALNIDSTGRVYGDPQSGSNIPIYSRNYDRGSTGVSPSGGDSHLMLITNAGTLGAFTDRLPTQYMPFSLDGGTTTISVSSTNAGTGYYAGTKTVTWNQTRMPELPDTLLTTPHSSNTDGAVTSTVTNITGSAFTIIVRRNNNFSTDVSWLVYANSIG